MHKSLGALIFALFIGWISATCPTGSKALPGQNYCVQFVAKNLTWIDAKKKCSSLNGKLLMLSGPQDAVQLRALYPYNKTTFRLAWVGICGEPTGHQIYINGTDGTPYNYIPDIMIANGITPTSLLTQIQNCVSKITVNSCSTMIQHYKCFATAIKAIASGKVDYKSFQQYIRLGAYNTQAIVSDATCLKSFKTAFFPDPQPKLNLTNCYSGNALDLGRGSDSGFADLWIADPSKKIGVLCQIPKK